jgi:energy-coupling factor transporter ATP-binding protein EcfA2
MNIDSISATNFKNLDLIDVPFRPVTLVMGENGVGKSNLLQLVNFLFRAKEPIEVQNVQFPLDGLVDDDDLVARGKTDGSAAVLLTTDSDVFRAAWGALGPKFKDKYAKKVQLKFRFWREVRGTALKLTDITIGSSHVYGEGPKDPKPPSGAVAKIQEWMLQELRNSTIYIPTNRLPGRLTVPYSGDLRVNAVANLENTILRLLSDPHANQAEIDAIEETLKTFFGIEDIRATLGLEDSQLGERYLPPPGQTRDAGVSRPLTDLKVGIRVREKNKEWFGLDKVGSGLQQILVIVTMLIQNKARIALVEEFDSSLSPSRRKALLDHLVSITGRNLVVSQLVTTTHGAFRFSSPRPMGLRPIVSAEGRVNFKPANRKFWEDHTLIDPKK